MQRTGLVAAGYAILEPWGLEPWGLAPWGRMAVRALGVIMTILLGACSTGGFSDFGLSSLTSSTPAKTFNAVGSGSVKVALLLPLSATGDTGAKAKALKQAAELALFEFNNPDIVLVPKDTRGTAGGATVAAQQAIAEGAELIIGPLIAPSVAAVGTIARNANISVIAFSTDSNVAGRSVYLLSFLPNDDIAQIVEYAAAKGKKSFAALLPQDAYGTLAEGTLRQAVARIGGGIQAVEKYPLNPEGMAGAATRLAPVAKGSRPSVSAILMPDGPSALPSLVQTLTANGVDPRTVKFLGSGQWVDSKIGTERALVGSWYAGPEPTGWLNFIVRYQANYGTKPPRIATLAYDAVSLAASLASKPRGQRYSQGALTNPNGFSGVDGIFRLLPSGLNQRGLAILEVQAGGAMGKVIRPAPKTFAARSF